VNLNYTRGELTLTVDYKYKTAHLLGLKFQLGDRVIIGSGGKLNQGIHFLWYVILNFGGGEIWESFKE
jgi:hypothetical protein